jgi:hypothetical protein
VIKPDHVALKPLELLCENNIDNVWKCRLQKPSNAISRAEWVILAGVQRPDTDRNEIKIVIVKF